MEKFETLNEIELKGVIGGKTKKTKGGINWGKVAKCGLAVGTASVSSAITGNVPLWIASSVSAYAGSCM